MQRPRSAATTASSAGTRPTAAVVTGAATSTVTKPACCLLQYLRAREIGLAPPYLRPKRIVASRPAAALLEKRKASALEATDADDAMTAAASAPRCSLLPSGAHLPSDLFVRPVTPWRRGLLFPRPPQHLRFRLSSLWNLQQHPRMREHIFLAFDRTGTLLLSYLKCARRARYTLFCWRFEPFQPLQLAASYDLFCADEQQQPLSEEQQLFRAMGIPGGDADDAHLYVQLLEATDSSCFVVVGTPAAFGSSGVRHDQPVKALVSIVPSPALPAKGRTHETHFAFVSGLSTPLMDLITLPSDDCNKAATHCLTFSGVDAVLALRFTMDADRPATATLDAMPDTQSLQRSSSLLSSALTCTSWLHSVSSTCESTDADLPHVAAALKQACLSLDVERFARDSCVGGRFVLDDYGFVALSVDGVQAPSMAHHTKTLLLVVRSVDPEAAQNDEFDILSSGDGGQDDERFEASLIHWRLDDRSRSGVSIPQVSQSAPLPWSQKRLRELLRARESANPTSRLSSAERLAQAAAHSLQRDQLQRVNLALLRTPVTNAPLHTGQSRAFLLNFVFPYVVVL